jgi:hypothetical protein
MKNFTSYLLLTFLFAGVLCAQEKYPVQNDVITGLFSRLTESTNDPERQQINDSIKQFAREYAASETVFSFNYDARYLGQVTSPDSLVKIITWNLLLESGKNEFFCFLVKKETNTGNSISELTGEFSDKPLLSDTTYTISDWYGALYYDIHPLPDGKKNCWVVLGLDYGSSDISRKIVDVISFEGQKPVFGKKLFRDPEGLKYRHVFEYSSLGSMTLRFASDSTIVFDHLVPIFQDRGKTYLGPDFSYDSYTFSDGKWIFKLNVDARNKE